MGALPPEGRGRGVARREGEARPASGAPRAPRAPRPDADVSFPLPLHLLTPPSQISPEVPPHSLPGTANQLFLRFPELATGLGTKGRGFTNSVPIGLRSGGFWALIG